MSIILAGLFALVPIIQPVSCGNRLDFSMMYGLVPEEGWTGVSGIPFATGDVFTEATFLTGPKGCFRVLSTGVTAGLRPSIGSWVTKDTYAGFLEVSGVEARFWDLGRGTGAGVSRGAVTIEARNLKAEDPDFYGGYSSRRVILAAGEKAFTAGFALPLAEGVLVGPAWCQDTDAGRLWVVSELSSGPLKITSAGAVTGSSFRRRVFAGLDLGFTMLQAGLDEDEPIAAVFTGFGSCSLSVCPTDPGFQITIRPAGSIMSSFSHRYGGELTGEIQFSYSRLTAGAVLARENGNRWTYGFMAGLWYPAAM